MQSCHVVVSYLQPYVLTFKDNADYNIIVLAEKISTKTR